MSKLYYFTNLDFPEIRGPISLTYLPFGVNNSCEVAMTKYSIWYHVYKNIIQAIMYI